jgi:hypothetical protein
MHSRIEFWRALRSALQHERRSRDDYRRTGTIQSRLRLNDAHEITLAALVLLTAQGGSQVVDSTADWSA